MKPTERFSNRVDDYARHRPGYPPECIAYLQKTLGIDKRSSVADIGSGTGILTRLLLDTGAAVTAVEPNDNMRTAAEKKLNGAPGFVSVNGTGEKTNLAKGSIDLITVAQAFHWMDPAAAQKEFRRILKPGGHIAILWNIRPLDTPFARDYEGIRERHGKDYSSIRKSHEPDLTAFFSPGKYQTVRFSHFILLDEEGLHGQIRSSSFMPTSEEQGYSSMKAEINDLFNHWQENGLIKINYETQLHHDAF